MRYLATTHPIDLISDSHASWHCYEFKGYAVFLYWSQWDLLGAQNFLKSGHIFRFLNKDFQKDLGSVTVRSEPRSVIPFSAALRILSVFSSFASLSFWWDQPMAAKPSQEERCKGLYTPCMTASQFCYFLVLSFHFSSAHVQQSYLSLNVHKTLNALLKLPSLRI